MNSMALDIKTLIAATLVFCALLIVNYFYFSEANCFTADGRYYKMVKQCNDGDVEHRNVNMLGVVASCVAIIAFLLYAAQPERAKRLSYMEMYKFIEPELKKKEEWGDLASADFRHINWYPSKTGEHAIMRAKTKSNSFRLVGFDALSDWTSRRNSIVTGIMVEDAYYKPEEALRLLCPERSDIKEDMVFDFISKHYGIERGAAIALLTERKKKEDNVREEGL